MSRALAQLQAKGLIECWEARRVRPGRGYLWRLRPNGS
jgi:hypothetical protein